MEIPLGWRFQPRDYELLRFLFDFVTGRSVDDEGLIHHEDLFGDKEPWELFRCSSSEKMAYFFTRLKKKSKKSVAGSRVERTVGKMVNGKRSGNWHGQDRGKPVVDENGEVLMGHKRSFVYWNKTEPDQDGQWLLKEFYLPETIIKKAMAKYPSVEERKDFVLCRLRRKKEKDQDQDQETSEQRTSSIEGVPVETMTTLQITEGDPVETLPPAGDADDISSYFHGVLVETLPEPDSFRPPTEEENGDCQFSRVFMDFAQLIWNTEDVTTLIDFDA